MKTSDLITISEAARRKGVSRASLLAAIERKELRVRRIRTSMVMIAPEDLSDYTPNPNRQRCGRKSTLDT